MPGYTVGVVGRRRKSLRVPVYRPIYGGCKPESSPDPGYVLSRNWMRHLPGNAEGVPGVRAKIELYTREESWPEVRTKAYAEGWPEY